MTEKTNKISHLSIFLIILTSILVITGIVLLAIYLPKPKIKSSYSCINNKCQKQKNNSGDYKNLKTCSKHCKPTPVPKINL